jgi:hypothetical protein
MKFSKNTIYILHNILCHHPVFCVPNVYSVSRWSILDFPFSFFWCLFSQVWFDLHSHQHFTHTWLSFRNLRWLLSQLCCLNGWKLNNCLGSLICNGITFWCTAWVNLCHIWLREYLNFINYSWHGRSVSYIIHKKSPPSKYLIWNRHSHECSQKRLYLKHSQYRSSYDVS